LEVIPLFNELCCGVWNDLYTSRISLAYAAMCINLINESLFNIVMSYVIFQSLWFSIVHTQLHFICLTGNFRKGVFWLNRVAKWIAAWKSLKTTVLSHCPHKFMRNNKMQMKH